MEGVTTPNLTSAAAVDELIGNVAGVGTRRISVADLTAQLISGSLVANLEATYQQLADNLSARTIPDPGIRLVPPGGSTISFLPRPQAVSHHGPGGVKFDRSGVDWAFDYYAAQLVANEVYVDLLNGDDGDDGSWATPFATVEHAVRNTTASFVKVKCNGGVAVPFSTLPADTGAGALKVITLLDGDRLSWRFPGPDLKTLTWTASSNGAYVADLTGQAQNSPPHHVFYSGFDGGRWLPQRYRLPLLANTAAFASNAYGFVVDFTGANRKLYVKLNGGNVENLKAALSALYYGTNFRSYLMNQGFRIVLDGNHVFEGAGMLTGHASDATYKGTTVFRNGQIICAPEFGWKAYGGVSIAESVRNVLPQYDCFNYDASPDGTKCNGMEINNIAAGSGDTAAWGTPLEENRNASSAHGGANVIRAGNLYDDARGPVVNDTTTNGQTGDISWNLANIMRQSLSGTQASIQCSGGTTGTRTMFNHGNATRLSTRSIYVTGAGATAKQFANLLHVAATSDTGGTLVEPYDPSAP